jgi:hypothetical protein
VCDAQAHGCSLPLRSRFAQTCGLERDNRAHTGRTVNETGASWQTTHGDSVRVDGRSRHARCVWRACVRTCVRAHAACVRAHAHACEGRDLIDRLDAKDRADGQHFEPNDDKERHQPLLVGRKVPTAVHKRDFVVERRRLRRVEFERAVGDEHIPASVDRCR